MHYEGTIIRPPSEADSIILQVTVGCSHNKCTFCGTYKDEPFRIKDSQIIDLDIDFAATYCKRQKRVFLADGDVLTLPHHRLVELFDRIKSRLTWVNRISLYGNTRSILSKTDDQLSELKSLGLDRVYMGLETGHDPTLAFIRKGSDSEKMILAGNKVRRSGLFLSVTVLLGIAGVKNSHAHAHDTGCVLTAMKPNQIGVLTLMLLPNTPLYQLAKKGEFFLPTEMELLQELHVMVENINLEKALFQTNHASNYLPINSRLSRDKQAVLAMIESAIAGRTPLVPERFRAL
ncbi:MAG: radical SAM protein [Proteobacteria bacterium]|nr:radical SAM protein [Pseudomonadota bacterium]MBU1709505.1 radical SAM protein [Pseudomonadota bacterium]